MPLDYTNYLLLKFPERMKAKMIYEFLRSIRRGIKSPCSAGGTVFSVKQTIIELKMAQCKFVVVQLLQRDSFELWSQFTGY